MSGGRSSILPVVFEGVRFERGGNALLDDVSLRLGAWRRTIVLGPNGAGKSLLMRLAHGLIEPDAGRIACGEAGLPPAGARRRAAMVFQRPVLLRRSCLANVCHALAVRGASWRTRRTTARAALEDFGLGHLAGRSARVLSGGEQQRLALARAWALRPELLFLDEPTAALDPNAARMVEAAVQRFHEEGVTVVMATHDLAQARRLGDDILFLCAGRVLEHRRVDAFFDAPRTREAAAFLRGDLVTHAFPEVIQEGDTRCEHVENRA